MQHLVLINTGFLTVFLNKLYSLNTYSHIVP